MVNILKSVVTASSVFLVYSFSLSQALRSGERGCFLFVKFLKQSYYNDMQKGIIVHTIIQNDKGEVLILQRSKNNDVLPSYWDIPGGTLEDGEDPSQGAIRETKEETGLSISNVRLFFQKSNVDLSKNKQFITLVFHTKSPSPDIKVNPEEHDAFLWIDPSRVSEYKVVEYLPDCLKAYSEVITKPIN